MTARRNTTPDAPTDPDAPAEEVESAEDDSPGVGELVKIGDRYAIVVALEEVEHVDDKGRTEKLWHPVVIDLSGVPRRHEAGTEKV